MYKIKFNLDNTYLNKIKNPFLYKKLVTCIVFLSLYTLGERRKGIKKDVILKGGNYFSWQRMKTSTILRYLHITNVYSSKMYQMYTSNETQTITFQTLVICLPRRYTCPPRGYVI